VLALIRIGMLRGEWCAPVAVVAADKGLLARESTIIALVVSKTNHRRLGNGERFRKQIIKVYPCEPPVIVD